jgi:endonuclease/exonuclease/phosphatase family metal-dependent hydrolase
VSHPVGTLDEILAPCLGLGAGAATPPPARIRGEASVYGPAGLLAYGGSFGTAFLSTTELHDCDVLVYDTTTVNARGALYARVDAPGIGDLHVFGTHLSPGIHEEQTRQIDELFAWIDEKAGAHAPAIVVGDLNTGPTVGGGRTSASHVP